MLKSRVMRLVLIARSTCEVLTKFPISEVVSSGSLDVLTSPHMYLLNLGLRVEVFHLGYVGLTPDVFTVSHLEGNTSLRNVTTQNRCPTRYVQRFFFHHTTSISTTSPPTNLNSCLNNALYYVSVACYHFYRVPDKSIVALLI